MRKLMINYSESFPGLKKKPESYKTIADNYEWKKREVEQNFRGRSYDYFNTYLDNVIGDQEDKVIVECGCGLGPNLLRYKEKNICVGFDFSKTALNKLQEYTDKIKVTRTDISSLPMRDNSADFVVFCGHEPTLYESSHSPPPARQNPPRQGCF